MRWPLVALAAVFACSGADRPERHFLAVSATSYNPSVPGPVSQVLLIDRETGAQFAHFDFAGRAFVPATTPDGSGAYVVATGDTSGVGVIDLGSAQLRSFVPVPGLQDGFAVADDRVLVTTSTGLTAIDFDATRILKEVPCPAWPRHFVYNGVNGAAYAAMIGRQDLCVVTPDLDPGAPLPLPIGAHENVDNLVLLDHNVLLVTTYSSGLGPYRTVAVDVARGLSTPAPALDSTFPLSLAPDDPDVLYASTDAGAVAYGIAYDANGFPVFTPAGAAPNGFRDDRYLYQGVGGSCSTLEGPVTCSVGFRIVDPASNSVVRSFVFAEETSFGLFGLRAISLTLSAVRPFGSSVLPPRRSRR